MMNRLSAGGGQGSILHSSFAVPRTDGKSCACQKTFVQFSHISGRVSDAIKSKICCVHYELCALQFLAFPYSKKAQLHLLGAGQCIRLLPKTGGKSCDAQNAQESMPVVFSLSIVFYTALCLSQSTRSTLFIVLRIFFF